MIVETRKQKKIYLREISLSHAEFLIDLINHPLININYRSSTFESDVSIWSFVNRFLKKGNILKIICLESSNQPIGVCTLFNIGGFNETAEIFGLLHPDYWGQGFMKSAFRDLLSLVSDGYCFEAVVGRANIDNLRAISLLTKLGFRLVCFDDNALYLAKKITSLENLEIV